MLQCSRIQKNCFKRPLRSHNFSRLTQQRKCCLQTKTANILSLKYLRVDISQFCSVMLQTHFNALPDTSHFPSAKSDLSFLLRFHTRVKVVARKSDGFYYTCCKDYSCIPFVKMQNHEKSTVITDPLDETTVASHQVQKRDGENLL